MRGVFGADPDAASAEKAQGRIALGGFGRVKHWQSGTMVLRWNAAGVLEAENGFRKLGGYRRFRICRSATYPRYSINSYDRELTQARKPLN